MYHWFVIDAETVTNFQISNVYAKWNGPTVATYMKKGGNV